MPSQNGIEVGGSYGTDLPQTQVAEADLSYERNAAKFSKTKEYQALKEHLEQRILYYQTFLPNGTIVTGTDVAQLGQNWLVASAIIAEFNAVLGAYEQARQAVEDASGRTTP